MRLELFETIDSLLFLQLLMVLVSLSPAFVFFPSPSPKASSTWGKEMVPEDSYLTIFEIFPF